jgi:hypothetical protein
VIRTRRLAHAGLGVAMLLAACDGDADEGSATTGRGDDMDLSTATSTTRSDVEAAVAAAAGTDAGPASDAFAVEERTDPCFAEMGGLSGEVQAVVEAVADAGDGSGLAPVVTAVAAAWESRGYTIEQAEPPEGPAPLLFATAADGRKASLRYAVPKGERPWRLRLGASSPCVAPDA